MPINEVKSAYPDGTQVVYQKAGSTPFMRELTRELDKRLTVKVGVSV